MSEEHGEAEDRKDNILSDKDKKQMFFDLMVIESVLTVLDMCRDYGIQRTPPIVLAGLMNSLLAVNGFPCLNEPCMTMVKAFDILKKWQIAAMQAKESGSKFSSMTPADTQEVQEFLMKIVKYKRSNEVEVLLRREGIIK